MGVLSLLTSKVCSVCRESKDLSEFSTRRASPDGKAYKCRSCQKAYREENKDRYKWLRRRSYLKNQDAEKAYALENYYRNIARYREIRAEWLRRNREYSAEYSRQYAKEKPHVVRANTARRRARLLNATPKNLTKEHHEQIQEFYRIAQMIKEVDGVVAHVDHIYPLRHKDFCGLHVPWNLQILTPTENMSKGNRRWP